MDDTVAEDDDDDIVMVRSWLRLEQRAPGSRFPPLAAPLLLPRLQVDNQGAALDTSSMTKPGSIAHDATGEGHGKLVRNILDAKNEMEAQVRAPRN